MDILKALRSEESKFLQQANAAQQQLETVRAAIKILGGITSNGKPTGRKKRTMSEAVRAKISKASKKRWAKFRAEKAQAKKGKA